MSAIRIRSFREGAGVSFVAGASHPVSVAYELSYEGVPLAPADLSANGPTVCCDFVVGGFPAASVEDHVSEEQGLLAVRRRWTLRRPGAWRMGISFSVEDASGKPEVFVPAVLYRGNAMGTGSFPKTEKAPFWSFLENRTPVPACVRVGDAAFSLFGAAEPAAESRFFASAEGSFGDGSLSIRLEIPGAEGPFVYRGKKALIPASVDHCRGMPLAAEDIPFSYERVFFCRIAETPSASLFSSYRDFLRSLPPAPTRPLPSAVSWPAYRSLKFAHLVSLVERASDGKTAFIAMGRGNGPLQEVYRFTAGSFLVKSVEAAWVLARCPEADERSLPALRRLSRLFGTEDGVEAALDAAERIGRFFLRGERRLGVHQDCCDPATEEWGGYLGIAERDEFRFQVNARCNGETMRAYVLLYETLAKRGRPVDEFIELPRRVARFYLERQLSGARAGSFGRWWALDGSEIDSLGTNGAYVASFLIAAEPYLEDRPKVEASIDSAGRYYAALARSGDFFGDTLDADSCDKEAGAALLALFMDLYERDGRADWLDAARDAAEFVLTWIWQYDIAFPPLSPLGERGFSTRGMTSVSVAHHHLDFYGMAIAYDLLRLARASGDTFFENQAVMMLRACRQLLATEDDALGRPPTERGWQPEQINHADWDYFDRSERANGFFDIDIAWVAVLGLGAYERIAERFPDALERSGDDQ